MAVAPVRRGPAYESIHLFVRANIEQQYDFSPGPLFSVKCENDAAVIATRARPQPFQSSAKLVGAQAGLEDVVVHLT